MKKDSQFLSAASVSLCLLAGAFSLFLVSRKSERPSRPLPDRAVVRPRESYDIGFVNGFRASRDNSGWPEAFESVVAESRRPNGLDFRFDEVELMRGYIDGYRRGTEIQSNWR